jgi:uncharacterized protein (DUF305 family)
MTSKYSKFAPIVLALSAALLTPLASAESPTHSDSSSMQNKRQNMPSMPGSGMDMKAIMKDNNEMMSSMEMTGNTDIDFAMMMRGHHQGAIKMAESELRDGKEPKMRKMAKEIIVAQKKEIAQFNLFLAKHGHSADHPHSRAADPMHK